MLKRIIKRFYYRLRSNETTEDLLDKGLIVGKNFSRMTDVIIDPSHCWLIRIGDNVTLASRVHILAHDASTKIFLNYTKIGKVSIGDNVFIGAETVILPNVKIGSNVVVGANSTISKDLPHNGVYAGNPAKFICSIDDFIDKNKKMMMSRPRYGKEYTESFNIDNIKKEKMKKDLEDGFGFII